MKLKNVRNVSSLEVVLIFVFLPSVNWYLPFLLWFSVLWSEEKEKTELNYLDTYLPIEKKYQNVKLIKVIEAEWNARNFLQKYPPSKRKQ